MTIAKQLIIVGGGGFSREVIWLARECSGKWDIIGILDDNPAMNGQTFCGIQVIGAVSDCSNFPDAHFVVAVGSPRTRKAIVNRMLSSGSVNFATLIHSSVLKSEYVEIGAGSIITAGCILTTQITLGQHSVVNLACTVGHDVTAGDFCTFAPHVTVSGNVTFGDGVEIGTGAIIIQGLALGQGSFVGAGAVVSKNIPPNVLSVGCPARQVKTLEVW
jgi:sugar O-acyltransferase (sialic acid O-acetyltransferase NeuD family)